MLYFSFNLVQIHGDGKQNTIKPSQMEEGRNFKANHLQNLMRKRAFTRKEKSIVRVKSKGVLVTGMPYVGNIGLCHAL